MKIERTEIVGGSGDVADGAGDLGTVIKNGRCVDGKLQNVKPSLSEGSKHIGNYAKTTNRTYIRQNELANPDFPIEDKVFGCYTPNVELKMVM